MFNLSNKVYDALKWITIILLPALATLYVTLAEVWPLPYPDQLSATVVAVVLFLGAVLQISAAQYRVLQAKMNGYIDDDIIKLIFSNEVYDTLKWFVTILLPALSTLYLALADVWNLPYADQVSTSVMALVLFLGALLQISSLRYKASMVLATKTVNPFAMYTGLFGMTNSAYDALRFVAQVILPAVATLYTALATIWGFPYSDAVSATVMAVVLFMNALLQVSTAVFNTEKSKA